MPKTYAIHVPKATHYRSATCQEVGCGAFLHGWVTTLNLDTELGRKQEYYIRKESGRRFREEHLSAVLVNLIFEPGQKCFAAHQVRLDKPEIYVVQESERHPRRFHASGADWVEDFAEHQTRLVERMKNG